MSSTTIDTILPSVMISEIEELSQILHDAATASMRDRLKDENGSFAEGSTGTTLEVAKWHSDIGHGISQIVDCAGADRLASKLREEGVDTLMPQEELDAEISRASARLKYLQDVKEENKGEDMLSDETRRSVSEYSTMKTGNEDSEYEVPAEVAFLRKYDDGLDKIGKKAVGYVQSNTEMTDDEKKAICDDLMESDRSSYISVIQTAAKMIKSGDWRKSEAARKSAIDWELLRLSFEQSSGARKALMTDELQDSRNGLDGIHMVGWPSLPSELRSLAHQLTRAIFE